MKQDRKSPEFNPDLQVAEDFDVNQHVELHPGTDRWMMGDRLGTVSKIDGKKQLVRVKLRISGKAMWFPPTHVMPDR